jgi:hypothetical protein
MMNRDTVIGTIPAETAAAAAAAAAGATAAAGMPARAAAML